MLEVKAEDEQTILDYLNEDCWGSVLKYVPVEDLIRTEPTCRRWQKVVLTYLQRVRITINEYDKVKNPNTCYIKRSSLYKSFESWTGKLGHSVVATYCKGLKSLEIIEENCPNLEALELMDVESQALEQLQRSNLRDHFKSLQRLSLKNCRSMTDSCVIRFIADKALEGLKLYSCESLTGLCFKSLNLSNLKYLEIEVCDAMEVEHMLSTFNRLSDLTTLTMKSSSDFFFKILMLG